MNKLLLALLTLLIAPLTYGSVCNLGRESAQAKLMRISSRISFENDGGLFGKGVCWWHNRLQRSSALLAECRPEEPRPVGPVLTNILHRLRTMDRVVIIPGYQDFLSFTQDHQAQVQDLLDDWQKIDGFLNFEWLRGISGHSRLDPAALKKQMDKVFTSFRSSPYPIWIMAQIKGITSHSFLVLGMEETVYGYELDLLDSNEPLDTIKVAYSEGEERLYHPIGKYTFVPYVGFQNDFKVIGKSLGAYCGHHQFLEQWGDVQEGDVELTGSIEPPHSGLRLYR